MADRKDGRTPGKGSLVKRKDKKVESKPEKPKEKEKSKVEKVEEAQEVQGNGQVEDGAQGAAREEELELDPIELPPFQIIVGDRISPTFFKFQFKNVEYSSGRNKTFLCYQVDTQGGVAGPDGLRGYMEDEHAGSHAEEVFFQQVLAHYDKSLSYTVTWYTSSSPCAACALKLAEVLRVRKTLRLVIHCSRLFQWEESEIRAGLQALVKAGCKVRMMRPLDFVYVWSTFVENEDEGFTPWEDCQENYLYYDEKLCEILM